MVKHRMSDRKWIVIILLFLALEILWLLGDLQWIRLPFFLKSSGKTGAVEAGYVVKSKADLKRRGADSLVWESTKEKDILYYKDSLLTLAQSSAKLYLNDKTELDLSENTLVTLEQPDDRTHSEIRLRFSKGDVKARNPSAKASIQGDDWVVNLEKGSEVSLRKEKDSYEFEVISGRASLQTEKGTESLQDSKILKLGENQQIEQIEKTKNLQWTEKKPLRIYVFEDQAEIPLEWSGSAKALTISKANENEAEQPLQAGQQSAKINLKLGTYKVRLQDQTGVSAAKEIEVWKAPKIYLKKPLPRDRLVAGEEHEFIWSSEPGVKDYRLKIHAKDEKEATVKNSVDNFLSLKFDENTDLNWTVEGRDDEGHVIPSQIKNKIYIRKNPLQAPKLKTPSLREKSPPSGSFHWWQLFITEARAAAADYEVVFEWENVEGAEHYTIEISSDPEFKNPELVERLPGTQYTWHGFKPQKKYYWRVAGGSANRMGLFSAPAEVKPQKAPPATAKAEKTAASENAEKARLEKENLEKENLEKERLEKKELAKEEEPAKEEQKKHSAVSSTPTISEEDVPQPLGFGFALTPAFKYVDIKVDENSKFKLGGAVPAAIQFEIKKDNYHFKLNASSQTWKPKPETDYPSQPALAIPEAWLLLKKKEWGLTAHQSFVPKRKTVDSIETEPRTLIGLRYAISNWGVAALTAGDTHELNTDYEYRKYLSDNSDEKIKYFIGFGANILYQKKAAGSGIHGNLLILFGADSF